MLLMVQALCVILSAHILILPLYLPFPLQLVLLPAHRPLPFRGHLVVLSGQRATGSAI